MATTREPSADGTVRSTFFGTSSVLLTDGSTAIMTDGFFTRPSLPQVRFGKIAPNLRTISEALERAGITELDAVFVAHSHHDHVMDAPEVVLRTGATLFGSDSTLNVGRGWGLDENRMRVIRDGDVYVFGDFQVTVFEGVHSPGDFSPGEIPGPLTPPCKAKAYRNGGCFSFHVTHPQGTMLIHPSANYVPHKFDGLQVDTLYLGIGVLGAQSPEFRDQYWAHVVEATSPTLIVPIHWDNFGRSLFRPLRPMPRILDRAERTKAFLAERLEGSAIKLRYQDAFETIEPMRH